MFDFLFLGGGRAGDFLKDFLGYFLGYFLGDFLAGFSPRYFSMGN